MDVAYDCPESPEAKARKDISSGMPVVDDSRDGYKKGDPHWDHSKCDEEEPGIVNERAAAGSDVMEEDASGVEHGGHRQRGVTRRKRLPGLVGVIDIIEVVAHSHKGVVVWSGHGY